MQNYDLESAGSEQRELGAPSEGGPPSNTEILLQT